MKRATFGKTSWPNQFLCSHSQDNSNRLVSITHDPSFPLSCLSLPKSGFNLIGFWFLFELPIDSIQTRSCNPFVRFSWKQEISKIKLLSKFAYLIFLWRSSPIIWILKNFHKLCLVIDDHILVRLDMSYSTFNHQTGYFNFGWSDVVVILAIFWVPLPLYKVFCWRVIAVIDCTTVKLNFCKLYLALYF